MTKDQKRTHQKIKKKTLKNRKIPTLRLDNGVEMPAKSVYMKDNTKCFKISDVGIDKIRVSEEKLYSKEHNSYKHYVFCEHDSEYIPLRIILRDMFGYDKDYQNKDSSKYSAKK